MDIFKFKSSVTFLTEYIRNHPQRGVQSRLAEAAGCQRSYFSQVLKGQASLTQDQAIAISEHLALGPDETHFFILLVSHARAGTEKLRRFYENEISSLVAERENLSKRFTVETLSEADHKMIYYSSWLLSAIHVLIGIESFQTVASIADRLSISKDQCTRCLAQLNEIGLAEEYRRGHWRNTKTILHLPKGSPLSSTNHQNWRQRAVQDAQLPRKDAKQNASIHYTAVMSISKKDIPLLKSLMTDALDRGRTLVQASGKEELVCLTCDVFEV